MKHSFSLLFLLFWAVTVDLFAADWPSYRGDVARTAMTTETLTLPMKLLWIYKPAQGPHPAWPDPVFELNQMDFDCAFIPVVASGLVLFGSSADDCIRALDLKTGALRWRFVTGGPVRFAPTVDQGSVYVASDDGWLYCIDLVTGLEKWKHRAAISNRSLLGANRLISRWPMRSGVLVDKNVAYYTAGMWPSEGVFVFALDTQTGKDIWVNDTSGCDFRDQPHAPGAAMSGVSPQGYLFATEKFLMVPTGRATPAVYDRSNGDLLNYLHSEQRLWGGTWNAADLKKGTFITGLGVRMCQIDIASGEKTDDWRKPDFSRVAPPHAIVAGEMRIQAQEGEVVIYNKADKEIWREPVDGKAQGLAIADGYLIVSSSNGEIYCFSTKETSTPTVISEQPTKTDSVYESKELKEILTLISKHGISKGYALLRGVENGQLAARLADGTGLHVIVVPKETTQVSKIREFLLNQTDFYGSRVSVIEPELITSGALPTYFANLIFVASKVDTAELKELYRLLRPCGGVMTLPEISAEEGGRLTKAASIPDDEVHTTDSALVVRGKLEGAFDWDSKNSVDQRVEWPLELAWFGPPGPDVTVDRHIMIDTVPIPVVSNGRIYQLGSNHLLAVDAYNGTILWKRDLPYAVGSPKRMIVQGLKANGQSVFLDLGKVVYQIDAQTGLEQKVYGEFKTPERFSLETPQKFEVDCAPEPSRKVELEKIQEGLKITLTDERIVFKDYEGWELFFDFRPAERRIHLYEPGVYMCAIQSMNGQLRPTMSAEVEGNDDVRLPSYFGPAVPKVNIDTQRSKNQTTFVVTMSWEEIQKMAGFEPGEFAFGARLVHDGPGVHKSGRKNTRIIHSNLFCDEYASFFNNGWAVFDIPGIPVQTCVVKDVSSVLNRSEIPEASLREERASYSVESGLSGYKDFATTLRWGISPLRPTPENNSEKIQRKAFPHPLLGTDLRPYYSRTYGCGSVVSSEKMDFFRSATLAYFCYKDNSGLRNFGGLKTSCGGPGNIIPAFGMFVAIEGSSGCRCAYNFQTSLALVPTEYRKNEDWAVFTDVEQRKGRNIKFDVYPNEGAEIIQYHVNLGAPGDRRDEGGDLWLGYPRVSAYLQLKSWGMPIPASVSGGDAFEIYRFNVDRRPIHNSDRPWLYGTGYRDVRSVDLPLSFYNPHTLAMVFSCDTTPVIDGKIDEACWDGGHYALLPSQNATALFRYDKENLYIAYERGHNPASTNLTKDSLKMDLKGSDVSAWEDDGMELFFSDEKGEGNLLHFAASAGGARYDGILPKLGAKKEDASWNPEWESAARVSGNSFVIEAAIPWSVLESKGIKRDTMEINFRYREFLNDKGYSPKESSLRTKLIDVKPKKRLFTVRLHFAEIDDVKPGERVFDVVIQGKTVIKGMDIRAESGAVDTAMVKEIKGVSAERNIHIEFISAKGSNCKGAVPLLSAIEAEIEK